ncbi:MAG: hypothetical protein IPG85_09725 [Bacteroidetes bacterium]|nr:hypothetical protein [Bacteroidota bacterium]
MTVIVEKNQTIYDIAIQYMGSAQHAMAIALNNDIEVTSILSVGDELRLPVNIEILSNEEKVVKIYLKKNIKPAGFLPA